MKHPFHLTTYTCYLHADSDHAQTSWAAECPGRFTAHTLSLMTKVIQCQHTHSLKRMYTFRVIVANLKSSLKELSSNVTPDIKYMYMYHTVDECTFLQALHFKLFVYTY